MVDHTVDPIKQATTQQELQAVLQTTYTNETTEPHPPPTTTIIEQQAQELEAAPWAILRTATAVHQLATAQVLNTPAHHTNTHQKHQI